MTDSLHGTQRIWVVDDDRSVRFVLSTALRDAGYSVDSFDSAIAALQALVERSPPDLLFTDVRMPGDDGLVLLDKLKAAHPQLPVIVMSAYTDVASTAGAFRGGAHEFLSKPFDLDDAVALAARALPESSASVVATPPASAQGSAELIGDTPAMRALFRAIGRLAQAPLSVLINGETGTGKELVAHALHNESPRARKPFVALNTAAIPTELLESELFGHEAGAFTGAQRRHIGRFEQADGGTLFLDEIGDMPLPLQTRLLRVLAENEFFRVGGRELIRVDVRVIAATHQDLEALVEQGRFSSVSIVCSTSCCRRRQRGRMPCSTSTRCSNVYCALPSRRVVGRCACSAITIPVFPSSLAMPTVSPRRCGIWCATRSRPVPHRSLCAPVSNTASAFATACIRSACALTSSTTVVACPRNWPNICSCRWSAAVPKVAGWVWRWRSRWRVNMLVC